MMLAASPRGRDCCDLRHGWLPELRRELASALLKLITPKRHWVCPSRRLAGLSELQASQGSRENVFFLFFFSPVMSEDVLQTRGFGGPWGILQTGFGVKRL